MLQTTKPSLNALMAITLIVVVMFSGPCNGIFEPCPGNYTPCFCYDLWVYCREIPPVTVKSALSRIQTSYFADMLNYELPITRDGNTLMADLIGNIITFRSIRINCQWHISRLIIDANAFRSTKSVTNELLIKNCDLSQLNWGFISNFTSLKNLYISENDNVLASFYTLPSASLIRLSYLSLVANTGLNSGFLNLSLRYPEPLKQGLNHLDVTESDLSDFALNCFLIKWITPYSKNTLDYLDISGNNLTKIPNEIRNYHNLTTFEVIFNQQPLTIQKNALNLKKITLNSYKKVYLSHVTSIQPGAFQGYYGSCILNLVNSLLTTIDEAVFKPMLQQMMSAPEGSAGVVLFFNNPIDCSSIKSLCNLAWIIRDNPSYLYVSQGIIGAQCTNGTDLYFLDAMALRYPICP